MFGVSVRRLFFVFVIAPTFVPAVFLVQVIKSKQLKRTNVGGGLLDPRCLCFLNVVGNAGRRSQIALLLALLMPALLPAQVGELQELPMAGPVLSPMPPPVVWEAGLRGFSEAEYKASLDLLLADFERHTGTRIRPGEKRRVGLKVYTDSGPGLSTPPELVRAIMEALIDRGYRRREIFIIGLSGNRLRNSGFLPPLSRGGDSFAGMEVKVLETGQFYDRDWYYDSPLPSRVDRMFRDEPEYLESAFAEGLAEDRRSFLPVPLLLEVDFWINLPVYSDHPVLAVNGALVNATLWNASNTMRFFRSPATAPAAVAEMAAIPELRRGWIFTIASLERYQFIGGPVFNSLYTVSEPLLWLSPNPVLLDALMLDRINQRRAEAGFRPMTGNIRLLAYAEQLALGSSRLERVEWRRFSPPE